MSHIDTAADSRKQQWTWTEPDEDTDEAEAGTPPAAAAGIWQVGEGALIMVAGVILPVLAISIGVIFSYEGIWRLTLLHPVETVIEAILLLLVPVANYQAWYSLCYRTCRHPIRLGIMNGIAVCVPAITLGVALACFLLNYPLIDSLTKETHSLSVGLMGLLSVPAFSSALYLTYCLRKAKQTRDAKIRTILYALMGAVLTLLSFAAAEFRSTYIRVAQTYALSDDAGEREIGLTRLREAGPERELKMVCADPHAAGLSGLFMPLDAGMQKRLYFAATGKPYRDRQSTNMSLMSNDYLRNHVVGPQIDGLSLHQSAIFGTIHPQTLSSTLNWTFVFKNKSYVKQEARAEMALPEGAVISDLSIWINGQQHSGAFSATENGACSSNFINVQHGDPALITDLGRGRYLMQASPVPGQGELKVQVSITEPLELDGGNNASFGVPRFIDSNFALSGHHQIKLRSSARLACGLKNVKAATTADGVNLLACENLKEENISNSPFSIKLGEPANFQAIAVHDPFAGNTVFEQLKSRNTDPPRHLVVVIDSSQAMKDRASEVTAALEKIPSQIKTTIMLAGDKQAGELLSRQEGLKRLQNTNFGGGQDNLFTLVKAAEIAGESSGGAVLWIHGPQPGYNNEMYLMAPYAAKPRFFEMALDDCLTDVNDFFKNHKEIGPFTAIPKTGSLLEDLQSFLSKWQPGARETYIDLSENLKGAVTVAGDKDATREVAILAAARRVQQLLAAGQMTNAAQIGVRYHIVTPVSSAVVLERQPAAPALSGQLGPGIGPQSPTGFSNGTIAAQGADATVIQGINTAGTVRVNNLANLESLLNIFANIGEILGLSLGVLNLAMGVLGKTMYFPCKLSPIRRIIFGLGLVFIGLTLPGCLNWLVASARDANLFD